MSARKTGRFKPPDRSFAEEVPSTIIKRSGRNSSNLYPAFSAVDAHEFQDIVPHNPPWKNGELASAYLGNFGLLLPKHDLGANKLEKEWVGSLITCRISFRRSIPITSELFRDDNINVQLSSQVFSVCFTRHNGPYSSLCQDRSHKFALQHLRWKISLIFALSPQRCGTVKLSCLLR